MYVAGTLFGIEGEGEGVSKLFRIRNSGFATLILIRPLSAHVLYRYTKLVKIRICTFRVMITIANVQSRARNYNRHALSNRYALILSASAPARALFVRSMRAPVPVAACRIQRSGAPSRDSVRKSEATSHGWRCHKRLRLSVDVHVIALVAAFRVALAIVIVFSC